MRPTRTAGGWSCARHARALSSGCASAAARRSPPTSGSGGGALRAPCGSTTKRRGSASRPRRSVHGAGAGVRGAAASRAATSARGLPSRPWTRSVEGARRSFLPSTGGVQWGCPLSARGARRGRPLLARHARCRHLHDQKIFRWLALATATTGCRRQSPSGRAAGSLAHAVRCAFSSAAAAGRASGRHGSSVPPSAGGAWRRCLCRPPRGLPSSRRTPGRARVTPTRRRASARCSTSTRRARRCSASRPTGTARCPAGLPGWSTSRASVSRVSRTRSARSGRRASPRTCSAPRGSGWRRT